MNALDVTLQQQLAVRLKGQPENILVTGANGFVGQALCKALVTSGVPCIRLDHDRIAGSGKRIQADVTDAFAVDAVFAAHKISHVVHGGGISGPAIAPGQPGLIHRVNVIGTLNLLEASRRHGVSRFVHLSSIAAYGHHPVLSRVREDVPLLATDFYGASKAAAERIAISYRETAGLDVASLRLASVFGPGRRAPCVIGALFASIQSGQAAVVSAHGRNPRQLIYIDDCVEAIIAALAAPMLPQFAYNIATGNCVSEVEVANEAAAIDSRVSFTISEEEKFFDNHLGPLCTNAARRDLGFETRTSLQEGLRKYWRTRLAEDS